MLTNEYGIPVQDAGLTQPPVFRAVAYIRTSTVAQASEDKISLEDQEAWAKKTCLEKGWQFEGIYTDTLPGDIEFDNRPQGSQLLENAKYKKFDLVLLYHSSRLAREPWVGLKTISLLGKSGIQVYIRNAPLEPVPPKEYIYGNNVASEYLNALSLVGDKQENIARGERVTSGFKNLAQKGIVVFAPYGYTKIPKIEIAPDGRQIYTWSFEPEPVTSIVVKNIYRQYNTGKSLRKIVKSLIDEKTPSPSGKTGLGSWSAATIRNILSNPVYVGKNRWGRKLGSKYRQGSSKTGKQKRVITPSEEWMLGNSSNCPEIIDSKSFQKTQDLLKQRGKVTGRQLATESLLPGLVYCGHCNLRAFSKTRKARINGYVYTRTDFIDQSYTRGLDCRRHIMAADKLESLVLAQLQKRLGQLNETDIENQLLHAARDTRNLVDDAIKQTTKELNAYQVKHARLLDIYLNGVLSKEDFTNQKGKLESEEALLVQEQNRLLSISNDEKKKEIAIKTLKQLLTMFTEAKEPLTRKEMLHRIVEAVVVFRDHVEIRYRYTSSDPSVEPNVKPRPCGYLGDKSHSCSCAPGQILKYQKKISGPLLDRIDIHVHVPPVNVEKLTEKDTVSVETSEVIRERVQFARNRQLQRYKNTSITANAELSNKALKEFCKLSDECLSLLRIAVTKMQLSGRSYYRVLKLSRTIADLDDKETIQPNHIAEALQYRPKTESAY